MKDQLLFPQTGAGPLFFRRRWNLRFSLPCALAGLAAWVAPVNAQVQWDAGGNGLTWNDPLNWDTNTVPTASDLVGFPIAGLVHLNGNQAANVLGFFDSFSIGAPGTTAQLVLTGSTGAPNISVDPGVLATINSRLDTTGATPGISLSGGGTLYLTNTNSVLNGNYIVDGAGTTLLHRQEGPTNQYNAIGGAQEFGRFDQVTLGLSTAVKTITLTNGGTYKIINAGNNSEGNFKNLIIGTGGGTLNLAAGYLLQNLDDVGQIGVTSNAFTLAGRGRLSITGGAALAAGNPLQGVVNINGGMLSLDSSASQTVGANTYTRQLGIAGTGTTLNVNNGGTLLLNGGANFFDVPQVNLNNGAILGVQADALIGYAVVGVSANNKLNIDGTVRILNRQLFAPQTAQLPRLRSDLTGTGTIEILGGTAAGSTSRLVIERGSGSTFSGTFRLLELNSLESNPRFNNTVDVGKTIADGDIEFAGWGSTLDIRDSDPAAAFVKDYSTNEITVTTTQPGGVNTISLVRGTAATGTGHLFNFGTLTMGNHRLVIANNTVGYQAGLADTAVLKGDATILLNASTTASAVSTLVFNNASALTEDAPGRTLSLIKTSTSNAVAGSDFISGGAISVSRLNLVTGTLNLRGANGAIGTSFGGGPTLINVNGAGIAANGNTLPSAGILHLDNNTGHVVGATTVFAAANHATNNRIDDSAVLNLRSNSTLRMTSLNNAQSTETIGSANVYGHGTIDIVKTGTAPAPVAVTLNTLSLGSNATLNFTGTSLGTAGANTSRIVIAGAPSGFLGSQYHQANEWAKYDSTLDNGFAIGVTPFVAADYTIGTAENTWAAGQQIKQNAATLPVLTGSRTADRFNFQTSAANLPLDLAGFKLIADQGGIIASANTIGFKDGATAAPPSGTAGVTAGSTAAPASLIVHANSQVEFHAPITDNLAGGSVTFVKSGTGTVVLSHQDRAVGAAVAAISPFITPTWSSTNTGGWVVNDGMLNVHRGQFLGATPTTVTLNGGQLEINEPVSTANDATILPGWGHHVVVNGNALLGFDDNGESADGNTGDRTLVKLGSLTVNNGSLFGMAAFSDNDIAFMGGATINGRAILQIGAGGRSGVNNANIISGVLAGSGFDVVALSGGSTLVLGGTQTDATNNTYNGQVILYGATTRMNKANGFNAITDGAASEDVVINGGSLLWGPGHFGDLLTTNQVGRTDGTNNIPGTNNGGLFGIAPTSPAAIKNAGMNQIADTANVTLLTGTLGEADRINTDRFGNYVQKNGTFNIALGSIEVDSATISGGAFNIDRGGSFKAGTLSLLPGAPDLNITTGYSDGVTQTVLEVGAGGVALSGQNIILGTGSSGNTMGSGAVLKLGGNLTHTGTDLIGGSYGRKGIFVQIGSTFRQLGNSRIDLMGGVRDFSIDENSIFTVTVPMTNGGLTKSGNGALVLEPYQRSTFAGAITVNAGVLQAKGDAAFGTSAGGVTINSGGTVKLDSGWTYGDNFTVSGQGSIIPGSGVVREAGALIAESSTNRLTGAVALAANATLAGSTFLDPSVAPAAGGMAWRIGTLRIESPGGVTGTGGLTLTGNGDGLILNGVNTSSGGVTKEGAGIWTLSGAGTYGGATTVSAGTLRVGNGAALGAVGAGTRVLGGALELSGGIGVAEPLRLNGAGASSQSGAVVNASGSNTLTGPVIIESATTLRSETGATLTLNSGSAVTGTGGGALTLSGGGDGRIVDAVNLGAVAGNALVKAGTGAWTIDGAGGYTGGTRIDGGTLTVASAGALFHSASALTMSGGSLRITGAAQTSAGLSLNAGGGTVDGGANGLTAGAITRSAGATADFAGSVTTSTANVNGILGSYATYGSDWAVGGGAISAFGGYTALAHATGAGAAGQHSNYLLDANGYANGRHTVAIGGETLRIDNRAGLQLGANNVTLGMGGLLKSGSSVFNLGGSGLLSGATANDELVVNVAGGGLYASIPLIGAGTGALTKSGPGELRLFGTSAFTGSVNINGGSLIVPGGIGTPGVLGGSVPAANRLINVNGGTFGVLSDWDINDWDGATGVQSYQINIGSAGGTLTTRYGAQFIINDGSATSAGADQQLRGTGDMVFNGGGRLNLTGGTPQFLNYTGNTTIDGSVLLLGHSNSLGGRQEQAIALQNGAAIINGANFGLGQNGLPNNITAASGSEFYATGGSRVYGGDIQLASGSHTIALVERDTLNQERQLYFNGRVTGSGVNLNVFAANNGNPFYLASGSNPLSGAINLNPNAVLEVRHPGSLGINTGDVTVNLETNSRLFLRHFQNGDFRANVVINGNAEINSDRLVNYAGGAQQFLSINNLTVNGDNRIVTIGGGNNYYTRVGGTATLNGATNTILNVTASDLILENGLTLGTPSSTIDKRGGFTAILRGPTNHTGTLYIQGGLVHLQDGGTLSGTSTVELRGGELRVDNGNVVNTNRVNDAAAINLGGGVLRITGQETLGTVTARSGTTQVIYNPTSETAATALTLTGFTRQTGAVVQFQSPDLGITTTGAATIGNARVSSRILIPGQPNVTGTADTIPGLLGNNNIDFIQYDGTTIDSGAPLGVRDTRNPGNSPAIFAVPYANDVAETSWADTLVLRSGAAATPALTANRALDAWKIEQVVTLNQSTFDLRIENAGILAVGNASTINGSTGRLYAGKAVATPGTAELFIGGNNTLNVNSIISNNPLSGQNVALVKTGTGTLNLNGASANTYSAGTYVNSGVLNTTVNNAFGTGPIFLNGGTLQFNIPNAGVNVALGGLGNNIEVNANSQITLDNGALAGTDNDLAFGNLRINGPYSLRLFSFDSMDATFTGTHTFTGTPTLDMTQAASGGNQTGVFTINGAITGSGFYVGSSGGTDNTTSVLQIGGGEAVANTYSGKVSVLLGVGSAGSFSEDLRLELNKAAGTTAITGDLEINGGVVRLMARDQIADTSNVVVNQGQFHTNALNETIASLTMRGGNVLTAPTTGTPAASSFTINGPLTVTGLDDLTGGVATGFTIGNNNTTTVNGLISIGTFGRVHLAEGATAAVLNVNGGLEMTGALLSQNNGAGPNIVRLNSDVTTFASVHPSRLGNSADSDTFTELNGTRTFTVADGAAALDLAIGSVIRDNTSPAAAGSLVKAGPGTLQLEGGGTANSYTGATTVNGGSLVLFKNTGVNAVPGALAIGNGLISAKVVVRNSHQIADAAGVTINALGLLDLQSFNTSETVGNLSSSLGGMTTLGPDSALTVNITADTLYAGSIQGGGAASAVTKNGSAKWTLTGSSEYSGDTVVNAGTLQVDGFLNGSSTLINSTATLQGIGKVSDVYLNTGGTLSPGQSPGVLTMRNLTTTDGTVVFEIGGTSAGNGAGFHDQLIVQGAVNLTGSTAATFSTFGAFIPGPTDIYYLAVNDGVDPIVGTFNLLPEGATVVLGGNTYIVTYLANAEGSSPTGGNDFALIPEPSIASLLALLGVGALLRRRRA